MLCTTAAFVFLTTATWARYVATVLRYGNTGFNMVNMDDAPRAKFTLEVCSFGMGNRLAVSAPDDATVNDRPAPQKSFSFNMGQRD